MSCGRFEEDFSLVQVGSQDTDGRSDNQVDADRSRQVVNGFRPGGERGQLRTLRNPGLDHAQSGMSANGLKIGHGAGGEIVNDDDGLAVSEQPFYQVRADKAGAARDQDMLRAMG